MKRISPAGFAIAIVLLTVVWMYMPDEARWPLFIVLAMGALAATGKPAQTIDRFFSMLR